MPNTVLDLPASAEPVHPEDTIQAAIWTNEQRASIAWWVPYADIDTFANVVFGAFETIGYTYGAMVRRVPMAHPRYPALYAESLRVDYDGFDDGPADVFDRYTFAKITVEFGIPPYPITGGGPYLTMTKQTATTALTIPRFQLKYSASGKPIHGQDVADFHVVSYIDVQIHQMQVPEPPNLAAAEAAPLNSAPFYTPWRVYPARTVMYVSDQVATQRNQGSYPTYQFGVRFKARPSLPWDWRPLESGVGYGLVVRSDGSDLYPSSDLNQIFNF